jgi:flagellar motor switch protein FliG
MPWPFFRHMTDDDLKAIFAYLATVKPVHHDVDNTEVATYCKRCNSKHGLGEHNDRYALEASQAPNTTATK